MGGWEKWDLVTRDDAINEHYSMRFVEQEGTDSSFLGGVIEQCGPFASLYNWIYTDGATTRARAPHTDGYFTPTHQCSKPATDSAVPNTLNYFSTLSPCWDAGCWAR